MYDANIATVRRTTIVGLMMLAVGATPTTAAPLDEHQCAVVIRLADAVSLGALQFDVDYSRADGRFARPSGAQPCQGVIPNAAFAWNDEDARAILRAGFIRVQPFVGPGDLAVCSFLYDLFRPVPRDFSITTNEAALTTGTGDPLFELDELPRVLVSAVLCPGGEITTTTLGPTATTTTTSLVPMPRPTTTTTTTTLPSNGCAQPISRGDQPRISDVLYLLRVVAGLETCAPCTCDVDGSGTVRVTDALWTLMAAVELSSRLNCPVCPY